MADLAVNTALPDVSQHLNRYTKVGRDTIDGQSYDVWRREWRIPFKSELRERYDIWISPSGEIGRTRRWIREGPSDWLLHLETDKIEINQELPAGTFATEPPPGYTLENTKETADVLRRDFLQRRTRQGSELSVLPCFTLEDGSIVAIWAVVGGRTQIDPNKVYAGLTWGGPLPQPPLSLPGLVFTPKAQSYGSVAYWDENAPAAMVPAVGRHLICTNKGDRTYEWALYVPQEVTPSQKSRNQNIVAVVKSNEDLPAISGNFLISTPVTQEQFARYLSEASRELSNDPSTPVSVNYEDLLRLARSVRADKRLYENFTMQAKSIMDTPAPEAVETVPPDRVQ
jgi:hypothetical protein